MSALVISERVSGEHRAGEWVMILENAVGSRKSTQALDAPSKTKKLLITNKVTTNFLTCTMRQYLTRLFRAQMRFLG